MILSKLRKIQTKQAPGNRDITFFVFDDDKTQRMAHHRIRKIWPIMPSKIISHGNIFVFIDIVSVINPDDINHGVCSFPNPAGD